MSEGFTRRQFFRIRPWQYASLAEKETEDVPERPTYFRPPGALREPDFLSTCERCGSCARACPHDVIDLLDVAHGGSEGTPVLDPNNNPCRWCPDFACIEACPSGALSRPALDVVASIGVVEMNMETCLTSHGAICDSCATACPSSIRAIRMKGRTPFLNTELCTGCGLCVPACPTSPSSLTVLPRQEDLTS